MKFPRRISLPIRKKVLHVEHPRIYRVGSMFIVQGPTDILLVVPAGEDMDEEHVRSELGPCTFKRLSPILYRVQKGD